MNVSYVLQFYLQGFIPKTLVCDSDILQIAIVWIHKSAHLCWQVPSLPKASQPSPFQGKSSDPRLSGSQLPHWSDLPVLSQVQTKNAVTFPICPDTFHFLSNKKIISPFGSSLSFPDAVFILSVKFPTLPVSCFNSFPFLLIFVLNFICHLALCVSFCFHMTTSSHFFSLKDGFHSATRDNPSKLDQLAIFWGIEGECQCFY